jgi:hypothetical protein
LKHLLEAAYPTIFALNLKNTTMGALSDAISALGVNASTRNRSLRFFLKAAQYAAVALSPRLTTTMRTRSASDSEQSTTDEGDAVRLIPPRNRKRRVRGPSEGEESEQTVGNAVKTIALRNTAGQLTLSGTFNAFELDGDERKLVYEIIDLMKKYDGGEK